MALNPQLQAMLGKAKNRYSGSGGKAYKMKEGRNTLRLLVDPKVVETNGQFWHDLGVHWIKADENGKPITVIGDCDYTYQQPSMINAAIEQAIASATDEESKKLYESWRSRKTVLFPAIVRGENGDDPTIVEVTPTTWGKITEILSLYMDNGEDLTDPQTGKDIVVNRTGKGLNTDYSVMISPAPSQPLPADVLTKLPDIDAYIQKEFFRGEEQKALNAIAQIAGVAVPQLGAPTTQAVQQAATPTAALTSPAAAVADAAPVETTVAPQAETPAGPTPEEQAAEARREELRRQQEELQKQMAALDEPAPAQAASAAQTAPAEAAPAEDSVLSDDDQDAILAELDNLG